MKPDYGKFLSDSGIRKNIEHNFYDVPINHLSRIDISTLSTMVNIVQEGREFAVSFDFTKDKLIRLLAVLQSPLREKVSVWLNNPQSIYTSYDFDYSVTVQHITAILGELQTGQSGEVFVPLLVNKIS